MKGVGWKNILPQFYDYCLYERGYSPYKVNNYQKLFKRFSKQLPFPFTLNDARGLLLQHKRTGRAPGYINYLTTALNTLIHWANLEKLPQEDFTKELNQMRPKTDRKPDPAKLLSVEEIKLLLSVKQNDIDEDIYKVGSLKNFWGENYKNYLNEVQIMYDLLFRLMYETASRSGEIIKLKKQDIDFSNKILTFYETKANREKRVLAIPPDIEECLKKYTDNLNNTDYLFRGHTHRKQDGHISQEMVNRVMGKRAKIAGLQKRVTVHMLRHYAITHYLLNGAPISTVQAMAGHHRLSTTELYTHVAVDNQREVMTKYNSLFIANQTKKIILERTIDFINSMRLEDTKHLTPAFVDEYTNYIQDYLRLKAKNIKFCV